MRAATILAAAFAGVAAAAAAQDSQDKCEAQNIVDACTSQYKGRLDDCSANDWSCLCQESTNLLTCYNNCPKDSARSGIQSQVTSYCGAASAANTSKTSSYSAKKTSSGASTTASSTATGSDVLSTATAVASESAAATSGSAGVVLTPAKGMSVLGGLLALAGAFL